MRQKLRLRQTQSFFRPKNPFRNEFWGRDYEKFFCAKKFLKMKFWNFSCSLILSPPSSDSSSYCCFYYSSILKWKHRRRELEISSWFLKSFRERPSGFVINKHRQAVVWGGLWWLNLHFDKPQWTPFANLACIRGLCCCRVRKVSHFPQYPLHAIIANTVHCY